MPASLSLGDIEEALHQADPKTRQALVINNEEQPMAIGYATEWALQRIDEKAKPAE